MGGHSNNPLLPSMGEDYIPFETNASDQLQLFVPAGRGVDPVNYFGNEHTTPVLGLHKRSRETEDFVRQQKLHISLNYNLCQDEVDRSASIPNSNPVSTGLRLSYDDDERNSSVTSASASMAAPSFMLSLCENIGSELERQKEEFDQFIKIQEEQLARGIRNMNQRHIASTLGAIEKGLSSKLLEKDIEIENMNRRSKELMERIKQVAMEAQNWHCRAKYNESVVNVLKKNLQQAISQGAEQQGKEGFGDSELDDTASYVDPNNYLQLAAGGTSKPYTHSNYNGSSERTTCRACKSKEVSMLLMPCRHLCLCKDCDVFINVCPVCQLLKTSSFQVFLS